MDTSYRPQSPDIPLGYFANEQEPTTHAQHTSYGGSVAYGQDFAPFSSLSASVIKSEYTPQSPSGVEPGFPSQPSVTLPYAGYAAERYVPPKQEEHDQAPSDPEPVPAPKRVKMEGSSESTLVEGVQVKTHFPVARIKRIMQADDDVGKVAQVTPVVVSKALELFMISLVTKAASEAKSRQQKRVTASHLKQAIVKDEQFDFLSEIVSKVPDAPAPQEKTEDSEDAAVGKKKRGGGRRKRKGSDDDF